MVCYATHLFRVSANYGYTFRKKMPQRVRIYFPQLAFKPNLNNFSFTRFSTSGMISVAYKNKHENTRKN